MKIATKVATCNIVLSGGGKVLLPTHCHLNSYG